MRSSPTGRKAFTRERAREIMQADVGTAFDPALFKLFLAILDQRSAPLPPPSFERAQERPQHERVAS
jgi:HD-GYP domain-containing protein (c-di-GMP phosphodiesterase class II)